MIKDIVNKEDIHKIVDKLSGNSDYRMLKNCVTKTSPLELATNWDVVQTMSNDFSSNMKNRLPVTFQKRTGRCWLFAATNLLRINCAKNHKIKKLELSVSYLFFYDLLEKANFFLEAILDTLQEDVSGRLVQHLLRTPVQDGGQWTMFVNIVNKYGIVPESVFPDKQYCCTNSKYLSLLLSTKLRRDALILRSLPKEKLQQTKSKMVEEVVRILSIHFGIPPKNFDWEFTDKDENFHSFRSLTPTDFVKKFLKFSPGDYISMVHSPREKTPFNNLYTVKYLGNVVEGEEVKYINVKMEQIKSIAIKSLCDGTPLWFGADVSHMCSRELGLMDKNLYEYSSLFGCDLEMTKGDKMTFCESAMNHAMIFTGVNMVNNKSNRWCVENSWGDKYGKKGYFTMNDNWFDEFVYELVVEKKYVNNNILDIEKKEPILLDPWDPLGALA